MNITVTVSNNQDVIKVVTGIRRCGKSSLFRLMAAHLREGGIEDRRIVEMNFESHEFGKMASDELYEYVSGRVVPEKRMYLLLDEIQRVTGWEDAVNAFRVDPDTGLETAYEGIRAQNLVEWLLTLPFS